MNYIIVLLLFVTSCMSTGNLVIQYLNMDIISSLKFSSQLTVSKSYGFCLPSFSLLIFSVFLEAALRLPGLDWGEHKEINHNTVLLLWSRTVWMSLVFHSICGLILLLQTYAKCNFWCEIWFFTEFPLQSIPHARVVTDNYSCQVICLHLHGFLLRLCLLKAAETFAARNL